MKLLLKTFLLLITTWFFFSCDFAVEPKKTDNTGETKTGLNLWENLIGGTNASGWHTYGKSGIGNAWKVENGVLHLDASKKEDWQTKGGGDIVTDNEYENFHLKLEWKIAEAGNSGIMFYVNEDTSRYKYAWESGPEMQLCDNEKNEDGKIEKSRAGDIYQLISSNSQKLVKPAGEWNAVEIIANNGKLECYMNGTETISTKLWDADWKSLVANTKFKDYPGFGSYRKGKIALQDHGADVWFRNVMIKRIEP